VLHPGSKEIRILHVALNMGGGLAGAVMDYARNTPEYEHSLLYQPQEDFALPIEENLFAETTKVGRGPIDGLWRIRRHIQATTPHIIHAHSSFAGAYVRAGLPAVWARRVAYTPHCYSFHRQDVNQLIRKIFWHIESALTRRTPIVAACSPYEFNCAQTLPRAQPTYIPNAVPPLPIAQVRKANRPIRPVVVAIGRICAQKAPEIFGAAALEAQERGLPWEWIWVGGGDPNLEDQLDQAGVRVTGWVARGDVTDFLSAADAYVHTASWEGAPLTILEAAAHDLPILARSSPAIDCMGINPTWHSVPELVNQLHQLFNGTASPLLEIAGRIRQSNSIEAQAVALRVLYNRIAEPWLKSQRSPRTWHIRESTNDRVS
jgi:glycosyltransferase involved in cell wall biosynthesis